MIDIELRENAMGFMDTVKGWFNIGGVKVRLDGVEPTIRTGAHQLPGKAILTAKNDKQVLSVTCKVINEQKYKEDGEEKTKTVTLGEQLFAEGFEIKAGETKEIDFVIDYQLKEELAHKGGMLGAVGKLGAFAAGSSSSYSVVAECDVKGTMMDPSASESLKVAKPE